MAQCTILRAEDSRYVQNGLQPCESAMSDTVCSSLVACLYNPPLQAHSLLSTGGVGEAVISALAMQRDVVVKHVCVREVPRSGPPAALLDKYGISAPHVRAAAHAVLKA